MQLKVTSPRWRYIYLELHGEKTAAMIYWLAPAVRQCVGAIKLMLHHSLLLQTRSFWTVAGKIYIEKDESNIFIIKKEQVARDSRLYDHNLLLIIIESKSNFW